MNTVCWPGASVGANGAVVVGATVVVALVVVGVAAVVAVDALVVVGVAAVVAVAALVVAVLLALDPQPAATTRRITEIRRCIFRTRQFYIVAEMCGNGLCDDRSLA